MKSQDPIIIGGNGHSGTRVFCEILTRGGVFTGIKSVTKRRDSEDLKIIDVLNRWVRPYVYGELTARDAERMRSAFKKRLRLYFPVRSRPWGFKNPRTMLLLPFLNELLPHMRFVHVIRDGRDISLGNEFVHGNPYADAYLDDEEIGISPEEKMILFWGRSNAKAMAYATEHMQGRYMQMRWEDLCEQPQINTREILRFANCSLEGSDAIATVVKRPASLGRWRSFPEHLQSKVCSRGQPWLTMFGYG